MLTRNTASSLFDAESDIECLNFNYIQVIHIDTIKKVLLEIKGQFSL
jgi:hypothetical protein